MKRVAYGLELKDGRIKEVIYDEDDRLEENMKAVLIRTLNATLKTLEIINPGIIPEEIKTYHLLESFIYSIMKQPKYAVGNYVIIKSFGIERIPNSEINVEITGIIIDYTKKEILYSICYELENMYNFKTVKEEDIIDIQSINPTSKNYYGRDNMERYQYQKMIERNSKKD